jgi:hypothetical protein
MKENILEILNQHKFFCAISEDNFEKVAELIDAAIGMTVSNAKKEIHTHWKSGCFCPACDQFVKVYRRKLDRGMAYGLISLFKIHKQNNNFDTFIHATSEFTKRKINPSDAQISKLRYWGLVEPKEDANGKKDAGFWRITPKGVRFVLNNERINKYVYIYNGKRYMQFDNDNLETTTIHESLSEEFNYIELMSTEF